MQHTESIILKKQLLREADLLITFFSIDEGKIKGVAKSAKRSKKRFGGMLEAGYIVDFAYKSTGNSELVNINEANLIYPKGYHQHTMEESAAVWLALELALRYLPDNEESQEKYELLKRFLIASHEKRLSRGILVYFLYRWVTLAGFLPALKTDMTIGDGLIHYKFKGKTIGILDRIIAGDINFKIENEEFEDAVRFITKYTTTVLGRPLNTETYLPMLIDI